MTQILGIEKEKDRIVEEVRKTMPSVTWWDLVHRAQGFADCARQNAAAEPTLIDLKAVTH
ncbi:MAG TPA: hypothetical protein VD994_17985 [Prosthecobacter sp.]|nr:hypothetical protein [Prosthecobacter sp.]